MEAPPIEIEAKFAVPRLDPIRSQLLDRSARLLLPRLQETNLRFDDPNGRLASDGRVLRLRTNHDTRLTYKAPGPDPEHRVEVELEIDDAAAARQLLEGLGFGYNTMAALLTRGRIWIPFLHHLMPLVIGIALLSQTT